MRSPDAARPLLAAAVETLAAAVEPADAARPGKPNGWAAEPKALEVPKGAVLPVAVLPVAVLPKGVGLPIALFPKGKLPKGALLVMPKALLLAALLLLLEPAHEHNVQPTHLGVCVLLQQWYEVMA